jgi:hypothetical protein
VFENRVLRRIFVSKIEEVIGRWKKLHNEELHNLFPSPVRVIRLRSEMGRTWSMYYRVKNCI